MTTVRQAGHRIRMLRAERDELSARARTLLDRAGRQKRTFTAAERQEWEFLLAEIRTLSDQIVAILDAQIAAERKHTAEAKPVAEPVPAAEVRRDSWYF